MADIDTHRVIPLTLSQAAQPAARAVCRHSAAGHNVALNLILQAVSVYAWDNAAQMLARRPAQSLTERESHAMAIWDGCEAALNAKRGAAFEAALAAWDNGPEDKKPKDNRLPAFGPAMASADFWRSALNQSLLLKACMASPTPVEHEGPNPASFYTLPSEMAQSAVFLARQNIDAWLANLAAWRAAPGDRGRPKPPNYLRPNAPLICSMPGNNVGPHLVALKKCAMWLDHAHAIRLTDAERAGWAAFPLKAEILKAIAARWKGKKKPKNLKMPAWEDLASICLIPRDGEVRLSITVRTQFDYPVDSFLWGLSRGSPAEWAEADTPKKKEALVKKLIKQQTWRPSGSDGPNGPLGNVPFAHNATWVGDRFCAGGLDLGLGNIVAAGWTDGSKADVFDAAALDRGLDEHDRGIDGWISKNTSFEQRALVQEQFAWAAAEEAKPKELRLRFPKQKADRLRELSRKLHQRPAITRLRQARERWLNDKLHQISAKIVKLAQQRGAGVLVIGQNKGWKNGIELGKRANRRFARLKHAELIKLIRQKLEVVGIAVVLTEESYTSEASFVDNDPLRKARSAADWIAPAAASQAAANPFLKHKSAAAAAIAAAASAAPALPVSAPAQQAKKSGKKTSTTVDRNGFRDPMDRDWFIRRVPLGSHKSGSEKEVFGPSRINADVNGAFNILRKASPLFKWHKGLSSRHSIWQMSWKEGLSQRDFSKAEDAAA